MTSDLDLLSADIQSYLVAPMAAFGIGGFVFDVEGESTAQLHSEVTDHYAEDNRSIQDHITRNPERITLKGYVGEVSYNPSGDSVSSIVATVAQKLTTVAAFLPQISAATSQIQTAIDGGGVSNLQNLSLSDSADIYGLLKDSIGYISSDTPKQQKAYMYFRALWNTGTLMGIQTPWTFLTNMAIESVVAIQVEGQKYVSDFVVRYKKMRFAQTKTTAYINKASSQTGAAVDDLSPQANKAALDAYRAANGMPEPPIDKELMGPAATQGQNPVQIGNVSGASLPTSQVSGAQSQMINASDLLSNPSVAKTFQHATGQ